MGKTRLRKGDCVWITSGSDKGREGKVSMIQQDKVFIEGLNKKKKHRKPQQDGEKGAIVTIYSPIHISNVRFSVKKNPVKLRVRYNQESKKKELFYRKKNGEEKIVRKIS